MPAVTAPHLRTRAFTLIELIVVIVILGVLAALAVTSFASSQQKSRARAVQAEAASFGRLLGTLSAPAAGDPRVTVAGATTSGAGAAVHGLGDVNSSGLRVTAFTAGPDPSAAVLYNHLTGTAERLSLGELTSPGGVFPPGTVLEALQFDKRGARSCLLVPAQRAGQAKTTDGPCTAAASANLTPNGTLEVGSPLATRWTVWVRGTGDSGLGYAASKVAPIGASATSQRVEVTARTAGNTQSVTVMLGGAGMIVAPGERYRVSAVVQASLANRVWVTMRFDNATSTNYRGDIRSADVGLRAGTTPTPISYDVVVPAGASRVRVGVDGMVDVGEWVVLDDVRVVPLS